MIRSNRKTMAIQVNADLTVTLRAPMHVSKGEIRRVLQEKEEWIRRAVERLRERKALYEAEEPGVLSDEELRELRVKALKYLPARAACFAEKMGVDYGRITIRSQKTRWGSCSSKGNLNFNCLLMLAPPDVIDYVVVHELCHRKQMNHSRAFWDEVAGVLPDYKRQVQWLREEGGKIMRRRTEKE